MYLFSGFDYNFLNISDHNSDMVILDTVHLSFEQGSANNAPSPRGYYGSVLLPNQKIIYIGEKSFFLEKFTIVDVFLMIILY